MSKFTFNFSAQINNMFILVWLILSKHTSDFSQRVKYVYFSFINFEQVHPDKQYVCCYSFIKTCMDYGYVIWPSKEMMFWWFWLHFQGYRKTSNATKLDRLYQHIRVLGKWYGQVQLHQWGFKRVGLGWCVWGHRFFS